MLLKVIRLIGILITINTTSACVSNQFPGGVSEYSIGYRLDLYYVDSGNYVFGGYLKRPLGGGRSGFNTYGPLELYIEYRNGMNVYETLDLKTIFDQFEKEQDIFDVADAKRGGAATLDIFIGKELVLEYSVTERLEKNQWPFFYRHSYTIFKKTLIED